jgi:Ca2+/H+ antiporter, TMEM165/GDT1 family
MTGGLLALTVFVATAVEMVEALTIVLAVGTSRGWRQALQGAVSALAALVLLVVISGVSLATTVPLHLLQFVVGVGLLLFGLSWLRKAVLRAAELKPYRDEAAAYDGLVGRLTGDYRARAGTFDAVAFTAAFKGVFLEGLEAAIIVITFGVAAQQLWVAFVSAGVAFAGVAVLGLIVHRPLSRVPENAMKLGVGILLSSFGTFWVVEGLGVEWPGSELAVLYIAAAYSMASLAAVRLLTRPAREFQRSVPKRSRGLKPGDPSGRRAGAGGSPAAGEDGWREDA